MRKILCILTFLWFALNASGADLYIAVNGMDSGNCQTSDCATLQYTLNQVNAGDTIKIKSGTYNLASKIHIDNSATHSGITITADNPNNKPLLVGQCSFSPMIDINETVPGITISFLEIMHCPAGKITSPSAAIIDAYGEGTLIHDCEVYNGFNGIRIGAKNVEVRDNIIHTNGDIDNGHGIVLNNWRGQPSPTGWNEKIYIHHNEIYDSADGIMNGYTNYEYIEISNNNIHDNNEDGIDLKTCKNPCSSILGHIRIHHNNISMNSHDGINSQVAQPTDYVEIYDNIISDSGWYGIKIDGDNDNWEIYNNLIFNNGADPARIPGYRIFGITISGTGHQIYHNTIYNNGVNGVTGGGGIEGGSATVKNNIIYNNNGDKGNVRNTFTGILDNNYIYPTSPGIYGTNSISDPNPMMTNPSGYDFTLLPGSPLIDTGLNVGITTDFDATSRPQGSGFDIGAYEAMQGNVLYVSKTGSDSGNCQASDCATINYALDQIQAGDTIKIKPGTYGTEQGLIELDDAVRHQDITITASDPNDKPNLFGDDSTKVRIVVGGPSISVNNVKISHLKIRATTSGFIGWGPVIDLYGAGHTVDDCEISRGGNGVNFREKNIKITNCYIHDLGIWGSGEDAHGISTTGSVNKPTSWAEGNLIENNIITYCEGDGFQDTAKNSDAYTHIKNNVMSYFGEQPIDNKNVSYFKIEGNDFSFGNQRPSDPRQYCQVHGNNDGGNSNYWIWNNIFHDDAYCGVDNQGPNSNNWHIWNNIFYNLMQESAFHSGAISIGGTSNSYITNNVFYNIIQKSGVPKRISGINAGVNGDRITNNIFFNVADDLIDDNGAISAESIQGTPTHNYIYSTNRGDSSCEGLCVTPGPTDITSPDPGFIDEISHNFILESNSVCINKGVAIADMGIFTPSIDKAGNSRDSTPDIGAYETGGAPPQDCASQSGTCCGVGETCSESSVFASDCSVCCISGVCEAVNCIDSDNDTYFNSSGCGTSVDCNDSDPSVFQALSCSYDGNSCVAGNLCVASCPVPPAENCTNGADDDCDGKADCMDSDCFSPLYCNLTICDGLNLLHHYNNNLSYGESSALAYDFSRNGNNGTITGAVLDPSGYYGSAYNFTGSQYITIPPNAINWEKGTISFWMRPNYRYDSGIGDRHLFSYMDNPSGIGSAHDAFNIFFYDSGDGFRVFYRQNWQTRFQIQSPYGTLSILPGNWMHLAVTWDLSVGTGIQNAQVYVDGVDGTIIKQGGYGSGTPIMAIRDIMIGNENVGSPTIGADAAIDELAIWTRPLTQTEIQSLYNSTEPINCVHQAHDADNNPIDGCVDESELIAYIDAWKAKGTTITLPKLMNAIKIWKGCT